MAPPHLSLRRFTRSLRARLLVYLLAAVSVVAVTQAVVAYRAALDEADDIFDYHMQQMASSLSAGLPMATAPPPRRNRRPDDDNFDFVVQLWTNEGVLVFESAPRAELPQRAVLGFSDVPAHGTTYRVLSVETPDHTVQVAQDMAARESLARGLALRTIGPTLAMVPLLMLLVWWVVTTSLAPAARVRAEVAAREAGDLSPLDEAGLPDEVRPLVHELNLLFARLRHAFEAQTHFVADAAHELRSPLTALKLQVQGLQRSHDPATRELAVQRLAAGVDRATRLVEQLLVLARHEATAATGTPAGPVDLVETARLALADSASAAATRHVSLGLGLGLGLSHDERVWVHGHAEALRMLVRNLVDNALKYGPEGGQVEVQVRLQDGRALLQVEDSGPGIPEIDRARVLDRFHRLPGSAAASPTGSGLGLAIVKAVADLHGARLTLSDSIALGGLQVTLVFGPAGDRDLRAA
jgi:two-component system, OmpR family, sensor kinase